MNNKRLAIGTMLVVLATILLAACSPQQVEVTRVIEVAGSDVEVTRVVEVQKEIVVTQVVEGEAVEVVVTATPEPVAMEPVELDFTVWIGPDHPSMTAYNEIAAGYMSEHPNVTAVNFQTIPFEDYTSKLTLQLAGSDPPDGGWILERTAPQFLASGILANIKPALDAYPDYNFEDFSQSALALWEDDNGVYGLPFSTSPFIIFYNADMFAEAGLPTPRELYANGEWTWDALRESVKTIHDEQGVYGFESVDAAIYGSIWQTMPLIWRAFGGEPWDDQGDCLMNSPETVAAFQFYHDLVYADGTAVPPGESGDFFSGQSAITIGQISRLSKLDGAEFNWDVAPLPAGPAGEAPAVGQAAFAIFNNSPDRDVAMDFMAYMTNEENSALLGQYFPSARQSVLNSDMFLNGNERLDADQMQYVVDATINGRILPAQVNFSKIELAAQAALDQLWAPDADVQAVMDNVCETIAPLLSN
ncbi:MAG: ABC transporter substrate-binding protein [Candidatus Promineifilaceae bacterium]